jgi:hypothetical protein
MALKAFLVTIEIRWHQVAIDASDGLQLCIGDERSALWLDWVPLNANVCYARSVPTILRGLCWIDALIQYCWGFHRTARKNR